MQAVPQVHPLPQRMVDSSESPAFTINKQGVLTYCNKAWLDYRGVCLADELKHTCTDYIHLDDGTAFQKKLLTFCQTAQPTFLECRLRNNQGMYGWFRFILSPMFSAKGVFQGGLAHGFDITEIKRQEDNAHKFLAIFSSPSAGIIIKDKEGRIADWNPGSHNIMGFRPEEMIGQTSDSYTYHKNLEAITEINRRLALGETISFTKTEVNHKDGRKIICSTSFCPVMDASNDMTGSVVIFHDVTAEKLAEQKRLEMETALLKSHKDTATILNEIPAPICVMEKSTGAILSSNAAFASMCASRKEHVTGTSLADYLVSDSNEKLTADLILDQLCMDSVVTCRLRKQDGAVAEVEIMGRQLQFQGKPAFVVHCMDLTSRRDQERSLREAAQAAKDASKMKSTFLANMSHEIRTPLNGVIGFAELALDEASISANVRNWLDKIKLSANGLLEIINDILDISKIEAGKIELEKAPFSLHDILQICETIITPRAEEKNVTLYLYAEPMVNRKFVGDQTRLRQILLNLLSNAVKFTNVGIVKLMSNVEEISDGKVLLSFEVKDSGIGMTQAQINKIFEPFAQADSSTTRKYGGTGLGLAITNNLVELMGSKLHVESASGIGSKFSFSLELDTIADVHLPDAHIPTHAHIAEKPQFKGTVLVCEDNLINQQVVHEHLTRVGLECLIMPNGKLGVEEVKKRLRDGNMFDLILMDIHMPVMDGLEATQKLLEMNIEVPIVALTANAMASDKKNYLSHGMTDYLAKPFRAHELWECLLRNLTPINSVKEHGAQAVAALPAPLQAASANSSQAAPPNSSPAASTGNPTQPPSPVPHTGNTAHILQAPATARATFSRLDDNADDQSVIDRMRGIENAAGNTELYTRLLVNFVQDNSDFVDRFEEALNAGNRGLAHRMAHTLKGVAGTIGAMHLYAVSRELEYALNDGKIKEVKDTLQTLKDAMASVFAELPPVTEQPQTGNCANTGLLNCAQASELVEHLWPLLDAGDSKALEYMDAINTILAPLGEQVRLLSEQIGEYDFEPALATLQKIKNSLELS